MGQIVDNIIKECANTPSYRWGDWVDINDLQEILLKHFEPQKKAEIDIPKEEKILWDDVCLYLYGDKFYEANTLKEISHNNTIDDMILEIKWYKQEPRQEDTENIMYDYGFQAGRCYAKHHPECEHEYDISKEFADKLMVNRECRVCGKVEEVWDEPKLEDYIGKDIWFAEDQPDNPMKGKIVAIDMYRRIICEYDDIPWEVFCDTKIESLFFEEPPRYVMVGGVKYVEVKEKPLTR